MTNLKFASCILISIIFSFPSPREASFCHEPCRRFDDCYGRDYPGFGSRRPCEDCDDGDYSEPDLVSRYWSCWPYRRPFPRSPPPHGPFPIGPSPSPPSPLAPSPPKPSISPPHFTPSPFAPTPRRPSPCAPSPPGSFPLGSSQPSTLRPAAPSSYCQPAGKLTCQGNYTYPTYTCSPPVTASTHANLTLGDFGKVKNVGRGPAKCDNKYHDNNEKVVALSSGWYKGWSMCGKIIQIKAKNGKSVNATVVGECDSMHGCDEEHAGQPPCGNNIVDASNAVWKALGLNDHEDQGNIDVTWSMA